jgi:hypothetical protein
MNKEKEDNIKILKEEIEKIQERIKIKEELLSQLIKINDLLIDNNIE